MESILTGRPALKQALDEVAEVAGYLWQKGWAERNGGNLTLNLLNLLMIRCVPCRPSQKDSL